MFAYICIVIIKILHAGDFLSLYWRAKGEGVYGSRGAFGGKGMSFGGHSVVIRWERSGHSVVIQLSFCGKGVSFGGHSVGK